MTTTTWVKAARTLIAAGTSNAAAGTTRATIDLRTSGGGLLTMKITNGGVGPTVQCTCNILAAINDGATPAQASAGADWKTLWSFGGGVTASVITERSFNVSKDIQHLEVEFTGNTAQAVTVEAYMSENTSISSV